MQNHRTGMCEQTPPVYAVNEVIWFAYLLNNTMYQVELTNAYPFSI